MHELGCFGSNLRATVFGHKGTGLVHGMGCEHVLFVSNVHHWCIHMDIPRQEKKKKKKTCGGVLKNQTGDFA